MGKIEIVSAIKKREADEYAYSATDVKCEVKGLIVKEFYINKTKEKGYTLYDVNRFIIETNEGFLMFNISGDCCSSGYIDHIGMDVMLYETEIKIEDIEAIKMPELTLARTSQQVDIIYGTRVVLTHGHVYIEYRNSSNGYYGSSCLVTMEKEIDLGDYTKIEESFLLAKLWNKEFNGLTTTSNVDIELGNISYTILLNRYRGRSKFDLA